MLKAIKLKNDIIFVELCDEDYKDMELASRDMVLIYSSCYGNVPEDIMILTEDMIVRIEEGWMFDILGV